MAPRKGAEGGKEGQGRPPWRKYTSPPVLSQVYPDIQPLGSAVEMLMQYKGEALRQREEGGGGGGGGEGGGEGVPSSKTTSSSSSFSAGAKHGLDVLLNETYIAFSPNAPDLLIWFKQNASRRAVDERHNGSGQRRHALQHQKRLLHDVISEKFKIGKSSFRNADVICFGHRKIQAGSQSSDLYSGTSRNVLNQDSKLDTLKKTSLTSVPADLLATKGWQKLLQSIGKDVMKMLLLHSSIFVTQSDSSGKKYYMQASGTPIHDIIFQKRRAEKWKKENRLQERETAAAPDSGPANKGNPQAQDSDLRLLESGEISSNPELDKFYLNKIYKGRGGDAGGDASTTNGTQLAAGAAAELSLQKDHMKDSIQPCSSGKKRKKAVRLPAWKRRKLAKASEEERMTLASGLDDDIHMEENSTPPSPSPHTSPEKGPIVKKRNKSPVVESVSGLTELPKYHLYSTKACMQNKSGFPDKHLLLASPSDHTGCTHLLKDIFATGPSGGSSRQHKQNAKTQDSKMSDTETCPKSLGHLKPVAKYLIQRAKVCPYVKLLKKFCPTLDELRSQGVLPSIHMASELNGATSKDVLEYSSRSRLVGDFIWAVIKFIIPKVMLGGKSNQRALRSAIQKYLCKKRFEKMTIDQAVLKMKSKDLTWFVSKKRKMKKDSALDHQRKSAMLKKWVLWIFSNLVVPLVQTNFYATDAEGRGTMVFFFRNTFWRQKCQKYMESLATLEGGGPVLEKLDASPLKEVMSKRNLGISWVRLKPKGKGMRVISNQSKATNIKLPGSGKNAPNFIHRPINSSLRDALHILRHEMKALPGILGASCFSFQDVYQKLCTFLHEHKTRSCSQKLFVVSCDVHKAYDSIDSKHVLHMVQGLLKQEEYKLHRFNKTSKISEKSFFTRYMQTCGTFPPDNAFEEGFAYPNQVLVNKASSSKVKGASILELVGEHLMSNVVHAYGKFYRQTVGIPQGSVLSTLLCSFYLASVEVSKLFPVLDIEPKNTDTLKFHLRHSKVSNQTATAAGTNESPLTNDESSGNFSSKGSKKRETQYVGTMLRFVDDYLYITSSEDSARRFLEMMHKGFPEYNCYMNKKKTSLNFSIDPSEGDESYQTNLWVDGMGSSFLKWCGLLINTKTFEIQSDYTRLAGSALRESVNIGCVEPGQALKVKLCWYLRFRCNIMLFDTVINSARVVRLNIYQAFAVCGMKLHRLVREMVYSPFMDKIILEAISTTHLYMKYKVTQALEALGREMQSDRYESYRQRHVPSIPSHHILWLGTVAFLKVLSRKHTKYKSLIQRLERKKKHLMQSHSDLRHIQDVVDDRWNTILDEINY